MADPVLHRDIKPANFLIAQELSNVVLADFGIVRALSDATLTQAFEIVGTPYYRAPEVLHGSRGTFESDVYGLGRLLEWLLTGEVSTDMATRPVPRGNELEDEACNVLDGIIAKATQVTPSHRFASVRSLLGQLPELWLAVRPRSKLAMILPGASAQAVLPVALELARTSDQLGWRRLQNQLRRDFVGAVQSWRKEREPKWRSDKDQGVGAEFTDSLLDLAMGRMALGLTGVYSGHSAFSDQRQIVDDLLSVPGWSRGGKDAIFEAPRTLVFVFQYLHGALCMDAKQHELALRLARMDVAKVDRAETLPLWRDSGLVGWPRLLGGNCRWAWEYLCGLRERRPLLEEFFALSSDYDAGLAAYSMLMVLVDLAEDAARAAPEALAKPDAFMLAVPPAFIGMSREVVASAARRTLCSKEVLESVASGANAKISTMQQLWSARRAQIYQFSREVFDRWLHPGDKPLPDLLGG